MSFSEEIKAELLEQKIENSCCQTILLFTVLKNNGSIEVDWDNNIKIKIRLFSMAYIRLIGSILKKRYGVSLTSIYKIYDNLSKKDYYQCSIDDNDICLKLLDELALKKSLFAETPPPDNLITLLKNPCCAFTFIKSVAASCGYFQNPSKSYHFEIRLQEPFLANIIRMLFKTNLKINLKSHIIRGENTILLYSKSYENLEKLLGYLGTSQTYQKLTNIKIIKEIKNTTNRNVNFETANLQKTASVATTQIQKIKQFMKSDEFNKLPEILIEAAHLRILNPYMSLIELAEHTEPRTNKSTMNNRLRRLLKICDEFVERHKIT